MVFPVETQTIGLSATPIESSDTRTSIGTRYILRLVSVFAEGSGLPGYSAARDMPFVRSELMTYGLPLIYEGKGVGTITVNENNFLLGDLMWGPKPKDMTWRPIAGSTAAEVNWVVEFTLSDCRVGTPYGHLMEFSWEADYAIDANRITRRDIKGMVRVPARRLTNTNKVPISVDQLGRYYEKVVPHIPYRYRRENEQRNIDRSKSCLTFSMSDHLMEAPLPPYCVEADVQIQHTSFPMDLTRWNMTLSATYKMALHGSLSDTFWFFARLVQDRIANGAIAGLVGGETPTFKGSQKTGPLVAENSLAEPEQDTLGTIDTRWEGGKEIGGNIFPVSFDIRESPQTRQMSYSATFQCLFNQRHIMINGLWRPVPGFNFKRWAQSLIPATRPRGYGQESLGPNQDVIIDLCDPENVSPYIYPEPLNSRGRPSLSTLLEILRLDCPPPDRSWIMLYNFVTIKKDDKVLFHVPLPSKPIDPKSFTNGGSLGDNAGLAMWGGNSGWLLGDASPPPAGGEAPPPPLKNAILQKRALGGGPVEIIMTGYALRLCYPIGAPRLISAGGAPAIEANRRGREYFTTGVVGSVGVPVTYARWRLRWVLSDTPKKPLKPGGTPAIPIDDTGPSFPGGGEGNESWRFPVRRVAIDQTGPGFPAPPPPPPT